MGKSLLRSTLTLAIAAFLLGGAVARAQQQSGNLYVEVRDEQRSALPGVTVTVSGLGAPQVQVTDSEGRARFLGLSPGSYQLRAELANFSTVDHSNVVINVGRNTQLELVLSGAVEETITVTAESPLLDERKIQSSTNITATELEKIPTSRDPWALLSQASGVQTDRINVGGNESGQQSVFIGRGSNSDSVTWAVDGVDITDMAAMASPTYYDFDAFEEVQMATGGSDATISTSGVTVNVVTKRGTNEWRGSGRFLVTDQDWQSDADISGAEAGRNNNGPGGSEIVQTVGDSQGTPNGRRFIPNQIDHIEDYGAELGGHIVRDRLWLWGAAGKNEIENLVGGNARLTSTQTQGQLDATELENYNAKLNAQLTAQNSAILQWSRGDKLKNGRGAGPTRAPETTTDQSGPTEVSKIEDSHVFNSNFFLTGLYSLVDGGFALVPKGGLDADVFKGADGVYRGSYYFLDNSRDVTQYRADGSVFFDTSSAAHELRFGGGFREAETTSLFGIPRNRISYHCQVFGCGASAPPDRAGVLVYRDSNVAQTTEYESLYIQDTVTWGSLTLNLGLRYDNQSGVNSASAAGAVVIGGEQIFPQLQFPGNDGGGFEWESVTPRLGATWALGEERRTLLRANFSQFAEQLGQTYPAGVNPVGLSILVAYFTDSDHDDILDPGEIGSLIPLQYSNFNPANPNSLISTYRIDPGLDAPITTEVSLGLEHALRPELVIGGSLTYRLAEDILEGQQLVDDGSGVRPVRPDDFVPESAVVAGQAVDYFVLRPGVSDASGELLVNGDREQEYLGATLFLTKRLAQRWMMRSHLTYNDHTWNVPNSYFAHQDPTNFGNGSGISNFGGGSTREAAGDRDGDVVAERSGGSGSKSGVYLNSGWSLSVNGLYQVAPEQPWGFNVGAGFNAREGYPNPKFVPVTGSDGIGRLVQLSPEVDSERLDDVMTLDLRLDKEFWFGGGGRRGLGLTMSLDAFNVLNENTVLQRQRDQSATQANFILETVSPRIFRLGARLSFD